jgi:hypothetical protein
VDWIITDPPYVAESVAAYSDLAIAAWRVLKPGGLLVCMTGHYHLHDVLDRLSANLIYHWTIAYMMPAATTQVFSRRVSPSSWKPVVVFSKGRYAGNWFPDVAQSPANDKSHHDWGQSEAGMLALMQPFVQPGDVILDPLSGAAPRA